MGHGKDPGGPWEAAGQASREGRAAAKTGPVGPRVQRAVRAGVQEGSGGRAAAGRGGPSAVAGRRQGAGGDTVTVFKGWQGWDTVPADGLGVGNLPAFSAAGTRGTAV